MNYNGTSPPDGSENEAPTNLIISFTYFIIASVLYSIIDIALSMATWSAASVGTPTEPRGRDKALRSVIWIKIVFMNLLLVGVLGSGIYLVAHGRRTNYGCDEGDDKVRDFEVSSFLKNNSLCFCFALQ